MTARTPCGRSVGVDLLAVGRMKDAVETTGQLFLDKAFTASEQAAAARAADRIAYLATRFAGKEAIFKTFGIDRAGIELTDIEIVDGPHGEPVAVLHGRFAELASQRHAQVSVSLAHDAGTAIAVALLSGE